jgi:arsenate reductase (glutaredoxin)
VSEAFPITIFHNPSCETSRNALAMIEAAGYRHEVVEYLKVGWTRERLEALMSAMGVGPRDVLREKGTPAVELGLTDPATPDEEIIEAMLAEPVLVNRPIVVTPKGVKLCRPSEVVLSLLDLQPPSFTKEDGEVVIGPK